MKETISYLNMEQGLQLELTEKYSDFIQGDYEFMVDVAAVLPSMPEIGLNPSFYTLPVIVPMEEYYSIIGNFCDEMEFYNYRNYVNYVVPDVKPDGILSGLDEEIQSEAERICSAWLGSSYFMTNIFSLKNRLHVWTVCFFMDKNLPFMDKTAWEQFLRYAMDIAVTYTPI